MPTTPRRRRAAASPAHAREPAARAAPARRGGVLKLILLSLVGIIVVATICLAIFGPMVLAGVVRTQIDDRAEQQLAGEVEIDRVELSWTGPQSITGLTVTDDSGNTVAQLDVELDTGLLGLALAGGDLGTITLAGTVTAHATEDGDTSLGNVLAGGGGSTSNQQAGANQPITLPAGLDVTLRSNGLAFEYVAADGRTLRLKDVDLRASVASGRPVEASITARAEGPGATPDSTVDVRTTIQNLIRSDGAVDLANASGPIEGTVRLPGVWGEILVARARGGGERDAGSAAGGQPSLLPTGEPVIAELGLQLDGGRLRLQQDRATRLRGPVPAPLIERLAGLERDGVDAGGGGGGGGRVELAGSPTVEARLERLDVPIESFDLRNAAVRVVIETPTIEGRVIDATGAATAFRASAGRFVAGSENLAERAAVEGALDVTVEGRDAGGLRLDAEARGLADSEGGLAPLDQIAVNGTVTGRRVPVALIARLAGQPAERFVAVAGESATVELAARTNGDGSAAADAGPMVDLTLETPRLTGRAELAVRGDRIVTRSGGAGFEWTPTAEGLRTLGVDPAGVVSLEGRTAGVVREFALPLRDGVSPEFGGMTAVVQVMHEPGPDGGRPGGGRRVVQLSGFELTLDAASRDAEPRVTGWAATTERRRVATVDVRLEGARRALTQLADGGEAGAADGAGATALDAITPIGVVKLEDAPVGLVRAALPTDVPAADDVGGAGGAGLAGGGGDVAEAVRRAFGDRVSGTLRLDRLADSGDGGGAAVDVELSGDRGALRAEVAMTPSAMGVRTIATRGEGLRLTTESPMEAIEPIVGPVSAIAGDVRIAEASGLTVRVAEARYDLEAGTPMAEVASRASVQVERVRLAAVGERSGGAGERAAVLSDVSLELRQVEGGRIVLAGRASGGATGGASAGAGDLSLELSAARELLSEPDVPLASAGIRVDASATGVPAWLVAAMAPTREAEAVRAALGDTVDLTIESQGPGEASVRLRSGGAEAETRFALSGEAVSVGPTRAVLPADQRMVDALVAAYVPTNVESAVADGGEGGSLTIETSDDARVTVAAERVRLPLAGGRTPELRLASSGRLTVETTGVVRAPDLVRFRGSARPVGLRRVRIGATLGPGAFGAEMVNSIEATAEVIDPQQSSAPVLAELDASAGFPITAHPVRAAVRSIDTKDVETWLGAGLGLGMYDGPLVKAVGDTATVRFVAPPLEGGAAGAGGPRVEPIALAIESPKLNTETELLPLDGGRGYELQNPVDVSWQLSPDLASLVLGLAGGGGGEDGKGDAEERQEGEDGRDAEPVLALAQETPVRVEVRSLRIGPLDRPLDPQLFAVDAQVRLEDVRLVSRAGTAGGSGGADERIVLGDVTGSITRRSASPSEPMSFSLRSSAGEPSPVSLEGTVRNLGMLPGGDGGSAIIDASLTGDVPTALVDALAGAEGLIVETLGPTARTDARLDGVRLDRSAGRVTAALSAERAELSLFGRFEEGVLVVEEGQRSRSLAALTGITPALSRRVFEPLFPLLSELEKRGEDRPTVVSSSGLRVPTDGDVSKLNGELRIDPGALRYSSSRLLEVVLAATANDAAGTVGANIEPIVVNFVNGVGRYEEFVLPWGEFDIRTRGRINFKNRTMNIVAFVPINALGEELRRAVRGAPGIDRLAAVPLRAKGPWGEAELEFDPELLGEQLPNVLDELIRGGLEDLLGGGGGRNDGGGGGERRNRNRNGGRGGGT